MPIVTEQDSCIAKIENNRDDLEALADSDLPCDYIAEALLEVAEDGK
jgi:hypothetical protein